MWKRIAFVAAVGGIVAFAATACADPCISFDLDQAYAGVTPDAPGHANDSPVIDIYEGGVWDPIMVEDTQPSWDSETVAMLRLAHQSPETIEEFLNAGAEYPYPCQLHAEVLPAPAAFGLGLLGLGIIGYWMRRFA